MPPCARQRIAWCFEKGLVEGLIAALLGGDIKSPYAVRYFLALRIGTDLSQMSRESQVASLVRSYRLKSELNVLSDFPIVDALADRLSRGYPESSR
jgi:hypothetical protein